MDRELFTPSPSCALKRRKKVTEIAVAAVTFQALPTRFSPDGPLTSDAKNAPKAYELAVVYAKEPDNNAHSHIETRQEGTREPRKPGGAMKSKIRDQIAAAMSVVFRETDCPSSDIP
ncbi:MAG: hypothetical protein QM756_11115 [Polyangiaceae bacterium]